MPRWVWGRTPDVIAASLGGRWVSTVRHHRFGLRRRAAQARAFLAGMEPQEGASDQGFADFHATRPVGEDRTVVTHAEARELLDADFGDPGHARQSRFVRDGSAYWRPDA